jgi:hypothetical protein
MALLNTEKKGIRNCLTGGSIEHTGLFFCKVEYSAHNAPSMMFEIKTMCKHIN